MGKFTDKAEFKIPRHMVLKGGVNPETITVNKTLDYADSTYQLLKNTTGSLDVILPPVKEGAKFWIKSRASSSSNIIVKDASAATISTLASGEGVLVVSDGAYWWDVIKA